MSVRITDEVRFYMERCGDTKILFSTAAWQAVPPRQASSHRQLTGCNLLSRGKEIFCAIGERSLYLLPDERVPLDDITEFVVHVRCPATAPLLELRVGNSDGTSDVRYVMVENDYSLRQLVAVLPAAAPRARLLFHSIGWIDATAAAVVPSLSHAPEENSAAVPPKAAAKLRAFRDRRPNTGRSVAHVESFGPGKYSDAADALSTDLQKMLSDVDRMIDLTGDPEPVKRI
jgi:hypothetical protein